MLLIVALSAVASSAILVRYAAAPAVALAFWRTTAGSLFLAPAALAARRRSGPIRRGVWTQIVIAGVALAVHFASWLASLEMTTIAAAVTLGATAPLMIAAAQAVTGTSHGRATWTAIGLAVVGTALIAGGDLIGDPAIGEGLSARAVAGDGLALIGAAAVAVYFVAGERAQTELSTTAYAARAYGVAAVTLLLGVGGARLAGFEVPLAGFDRTTWIAIGAMAIGPQIIGHTSLNALLDRLGSLSVSLALLAEPVMAGGLAWLLLDEVPGPATLVGAPLVIVALALRLKQST